MDEQLPYLPTVAALSDILSVFPAPRLVVDADGIILLANAATCELLGYLPLELVGQSIDILGSARQSEHLDFLRREWRTSQEPGRLGQGLELRAQRSDGTEIPIEVQAVPWRTGEGTVTVVGLHDLTSAQYDSRLFRALLDSAPDAVIIIDSSGTIRLVNQATEKSFGYLRDELVGQPIDVLVPDRLRQAHAHLRRGFAGAPHARAMGKVGTLVAKRKDGSEFPADISLSPAETEEGPFIIAGVRDLTDRLASLEAVHKAEEEKRVAAEVERMKSQLLATISHELRTPLASILGFCELITEVEDLDAQVAYFMNIVLRNARREARLVDDLLTLVSIDQGGLSVHPIDSDLVTLVSEAVTSVRPAALSAGLDLRTELPEGPVQVFCDPERIGQALDALLSNAVKFTPSGGVLSVELAAESEKATVRVTDSGMGIDIPDPSRVFERLYRSPLAVEKEIQGAGVGLSIAWSIAAAHQGSLELVATGPGGSTFALELPRQGIPAARVPA